MAASKKELSSYEMFKMKIMRLSNDYLVLREFVALTFFILAFLVMAPLARESDWARFLLALFGLFVIFLSKGLIVLFVMRTARLQLDPKVKRYSAIVSLNSIYGLALPIFYINVVLYRVVTFLYHMEDQGTFFCELRKSLWRFLYSENNLYYHINNLVFWLILAALVLFLFGGVWERGRK